MCIMKYSTSSMKRAPSSEFFSRVSESAVSPVPHGNPADGTAVPPCCVSVTFVETIQGFSSFSMKVEE